MSFQRKEWGCWNILFLPLPPENKSWNPWQHAFESCMPSEFASQYFQHVYFPVTMSKCSCDKELSVIFDSHILIHMGALLNLSNDLHIQISCELSSTASVCKVVTLRATASLKYSGRDRPSHVKESCWLTL